MPTGKETLFDTEANNFLFCVTTALNGATLPHVSELA